MKASFIFRFLLLAGITVAIGSRTAHGQFLKKLGNDVKNAAQQGVDQAATDHAVNDAGNATDKAISDAEKAAGNAAKGSNGQTADDSASPASGNNAVAAGSGANTAAGSSTVSPPSIKSYQNYDFVPGDTILFADDFTEDQNGEFPSHWELGGGQAVVNQVAGKPAFCLTQGNYCVVKPRMKNTSYLTDPFTIEFDTYCDENSSSQGSPLLSLYYTDKDGNNTSSDIEFDKGDLGGRGEVNASAFPHGLEADLPEALRNSYPNNWHHCAIIYKNNQLKCYVDQYRILVIPDLGCVPTGFGFEGIGDQDHPIVISNIRVAAGGNMNRIGKKFTDAKIVTHGITFDVDKSDIKPQSMGTLNMIAGILKNNPGLKFEIDGHTDNTGQTAHNLTLSQQRAQAVKAQLVKMGIDGSRLTTSGFGDSKPISDNNTPEGRANNRRVEFVRM
jgi:outer membrane protein OmpA-like peptidoglycan-associated protein